jgi:hypothetical protein
LRVFYTDLPYMASYFWAGFVDERHIIIYKFSLTGAV